VELPKFQVLKDIRKVIRSGYQNQILEMIVLY